MAFELAFNGGVRPEWLVVVEDKGSQQRSWSGEAGRTDQEGLSCHGVEFRYHLGGA